MPQTPLNNLGLNYEHTLGADDWKNSYDANWVITDTLSGQAFIVDHLITAEPGGPAVGDAYILGATQTGANWGTDTGAVPNAIALFTNVPGQLDGSPWLYLTAREGWRVYDRTNNFTLFFDGVFWIEVDTPGGQRVVTILDTLGNFVPTALEHTNAVIIFADAFDEVNDSIEIPNNSVQPFPIGSFLEFYNDGDGVPIQVIDGASVTYVGEDFSTFELGVGSRVRIKKVGTDQWLIVDVSCRGVHNSDVSGFVTDPNIDFTYAREGNHVHIFAPLIQAVSDATTKALVTPFPAIIRPAAQRVFLIRTENGAAGVLSMSFAEVEASGTVDFFPDLDGGTWSAMGQASIGRISGDYLLRP